MKTLKVNNSGLKFKNYKFFQPSLHEPSDLTELTSDLTDTDHHLIDTTELTDTNDAEPSLHEPSDLTVNSTNEPTKNDDNLIKKDDLFETLMTTTISHDLTTTTATEEETTKDDFSSLDFSLRLKKLIDSNFSELLDSSDNSEATTVHQHRPEATTVHQNRPEDSEKPKQTPVKSSSCHDEDLFKSWIESLIGFFKKEKVDPKIERFFEKLIALHDDYSFFEDDDTWPEPNLNERKSWAKETVVISIVFSVIICLLAAASIFFGCRKTKIWTRRDPEEPEEGQGPPVYDFRDFYHDDDIRPLPSPSDDISLPPPPPSPLQGISSINELVNLVREMAGLQNALESPDTEVVAPDAENKVPMFSGIDLRPLGLSVVEIHQNQEIELQNLSTEVLPADDQEETNLDIEATQAEATQAEDLEDLEAATEVAQAVDDKTKVAQAGDDKTKVAQAVDNKTEVAQAVDDKTEVAQAGDDKTACDDETKDLEAVRPAKFKTAKTLFLRRLYQ